MRALTWFALGLFAGAGATAAVVIHWRRLRALEELVKLKPIKPLEPLAVAPMPPLPAPDKASQERMREIARERARATPPATVFGGVTN
jgi:hypothetical protein